MIKANEIFKKYTSPDEWSRIKRYLTVSQMLKEVCDTYQNNVAVVDGKNYTFKEIDKLVGAIRLHLKNNNIQKGQNVGVLFENSVEFIVSTLAIMSYGAVAVLLPYQLNEETLFGCSKLYNLTSIITMKKDEDRLKLIDRKQTNEIISNNKNL